MVAKFIRFVAVVILAGAMQVQFLAAQEPQVSKEVQAWFTSLAKVNRLALKKLMAEETMVELRDLGIVQTRDEFLDSLDEWKDATKGAILLIQLVSTSPGKDVLEVCYRFENNEQLNRETYLHSNGKITSVVQELIAKECRGF